MDDGLRADLLDRVDDGVRNFGPGVVPGDALPPAGAAFAHTLEGVEDALLGVEHLAPHRALLAAHGIHVRDALFNDVVGGGLLFVEDDPVLYVDAIGAVARIAVHAVSAPDHLVPLPALAVEVLPGDVGLAGRALCRLQGRQLGVRHCVPPNCPSGPVGDTYVRHRRTARPAPLPRGGREAAAGASLPRPGGATSWPTDAGGSRAAPARMSRCRRRRPWPPPP